MLDIRESDRLLLALQDVEDPEFSISIVDLGLVVGVEEREGHVAVKITLTSMGCPAVDMIVEDIQARLLAEPTVRQVEVEVVWEPIWTRDRLSENGKAALREMGISV